MKTYLTDEEIIEVFINANLKEEYNLLREDLIKLAHAFVQKAEPKIKEQSCTSS